MLERLLINRNFARIWAAGAVSWVGDHVFDTTVLLWIATVLAAGKPWAPAAAGGVLVAVLLPMLTVGPIAGVYVDRWDPRRTMMVCDLIRAGVVAALALVAVLPAGWVPNLVQIVVVYAAVLLCSIVTRFFTPARLAITADTVDADQQPRAAGLTQSTMAVAAIIGPPLAAPLLFTAGVTWALVINAASFLVSYLAVRAVHLTRPARPVDPTTPAGFWPELAAGVRALGHSRVLVTILVTGIVANVGTSIVNTVDVFFVTANLGTDAKYYGILGAAMGLGGAAGAALVGAFGQRLGLTRILATGVVLAGIMLCLYARTTVFAVAVGMLLITAIPLAAANTVIGPILIRATPRELLGRVYALLMPAVQAMSVVAIGVTGWLASSVLRNLDADIAGTHVGTYDTLLTAAGLLILGSGIYAAAALRGPDTATTPPASHTDVTANRGHDA